MPHLPSLLLRPLNRLFLREPHHGDLGVRETGRRDSFVVHHMISAADILHGGYTLGGGGVSKHHDSVRIAYAVKVGDDLAARRGFDPHLLINSDKTAVCLDFHALETAVLCVGDAAGGDHDGVDLDGLDVLLSVGIDHLDSGGLLPRYTRRDFRGEDTEAVVDWPRSDEHALRLLCDLAVECRHEHGEGLDERDLRSKSCVDVRELEADITRPDDCDPLRDKVQIQSAIGRVHSLLVNGDAGRDKGDRAGGEDDVLSSVDLGERARSEMTS